MSEATTPDEGSRRPAQAALRTVLRTMGALALVAAAWLAREVLLLAFLALLIAVVLSFPVGLLARFVPRGVAVVAILGLLGAAAAGVGAVAAPTLSAQLTRVRRTLPEAWRGLHRWIESGRPASGPSTGPPAPEPSTAGAATQVARAAAPAAIAVVGGLARVLLVLVLAAFLVYEPGTYRRGLRRLLPREREATFDALWARLGQDLRRWVGGILVSMTVMGTLTAIGLAIAGIENWLLLGVLTFLGTFVPYLGALTSAIPGLLVAWGQSPLKLLLALAVYVGIHVIEGYVVEPLIMRRAVEIKPALLLFGQALFGAVFGVVGVVIATPALACLQTAVQQLWVEERLGKRQA